MTSNSFHVKIRTSKENARQHGVVSASMKKFAAWLAQRGSTEGPWEAKADRTQGAYRLNRDEPKVGGAGSIAAHLKKGPRGSGAKRGDGAKDKAATVAGKQPEGGKGKPGRKSGASRQTR